MLYYYTCRSFSCLQFVLRCTQAPLRGDEGRLYYHLQIDLKTQLERILVIYVLEVETTSCFEEWKQTMGFYALYLIILFYFRDMPLLGLKIQTLWQNSRSYQLFAFFILTNLVCITIWVVEKNFKCKSWNENCYGITNKCNITIVA